MDRFVRSWVTWLRIVRCVEYDALHLAPELSLCERVSFEMTLLAFDRELLVSVRWEGLCIHPLGT